MLRIVPIALLVAPDTPAQPPCPELPFNVLVPFNYPCPIFPRVCSTDYGRCRLGMLIEQA
jgi:hypothetical protein